MGSDGKISLPKDADGREIPLDTKALYDKEGNEQCVKRIEFDPFNGSWRFAVRKCSPALANIYCSPQDVYLEKPAPHDNWEKLLEDLDNAARGGDNAECCYMRREVIEVGEQCSGCRLYNADDVFSDCSLLAYGDIADRIRKLRGEGDA